MVWQADIYEHKVRTIEKDNQTTPVQLLLYRVDGLLIRVFPLKGG